MTTSTLDLDALHLESGGHDSREDGVCLLEAVAWFAGRGHTDSPPCVSPVLTAFGQRLNDVLPDDRRQQLKPYIPRLVGTSGDGLDEARGLLALDWLIRVYTPAWLRLVPALVPDADALAGGRPIDSLEAAAAVGDLVRQAAAHSAAAWDAAWDAARAAARAAAGDAARAAAGAAAGAAAWAAAWDAARAAARAAARDAAGDAARAAAGDAARAAAGAAAGDAARAAARDAAWDKLQPTVEELQTSSIDLYGRMISAGR